LGPTSTWTAQRNIFSRFSQTPIQRAWFYRSPEEGESGPLFRYFDNFILTKQDSERRDQLRKARISFPFLVYLAFDSIQDPGSCTAIPLRNQVADRPGDFCEISRLHPQWFLRDAIGNLIYEDSDSSFVMMDPANPGWRAFWLERARQTVEQLGWDGIFLDNVEASLVKRRRLGSLPAAYPDDASYQRAAAGFLDYIHENYFGPQGYPLLANVIELKDTAAWFLFLQHVDGAMQERFAVDWNGQYLDPLDWETDLARAEAAQALGKRVILVAQGDKDNVLRQQFAFASYLLVADGQAAFRYTNSRHYDQAWLYPEDGLDLGAPLGNRYHAGSVWKRDFVKGSVMVDPAAHQATIILR
jgi:hypothetical protein